MIYALLLPPLFVVAALILGALAQPAPAGVWRRLALNLAPLTTMPAIVGPLLTGTAGLDVPWLVLSSSFSMEGASRPLVLGAGVLYAAALAAVAWLPREDRGSRPESLVAFLLASFVGNIGVYLAADLVTFYLSFTVMSFAAAGAIIHTRTAKAARATVIYLVMSVLSETALLAAFIMIGATGATEVAELSGAVTDTANPGLTLALLITGFGIKAGLFPLHVWLPLAHPAAPPAASAVLSGVMVKAGFFGWLRFLPTTDEGDAATSETIATAAEVFIALALIGALASVIPGALNRDPKVVLAYSTISQVGFLAGLLGAGMLTPEAAPAVAAAALVYALHHGFAKGALFMGVGVVQHHWAGGRRVLVAVGMGWAMLALAGAPLTSGAFAKYLGKYAAEDTTVLGIGLDVWLTLVATASTILLIRLLWLLRRQENSPRARADGELVGWVGVCLAGLILPFVVGVRWLGQDLPAAEFSTLWDMIWPILLGAGIAAAGWWISRRRSDADAVPGAELLPAGDLVVPAEHLVAVGQRRGGEVISGIHEVTGRARSQVAGSTGSAMGLVNRVVGRLARGLNSWTVSGVIAVGLLTAGLAGSMLILGVFS